jgi:hypothetical protein
MEGRESIPLLKLVALTSNDLDYVPAINNTKIQEPVFRPKMGNSFQKSGLEYRKNDGSKPHFKSVEKNYNELDEELINPDQSNSEIEKESDGFYRYLRAFNNHDFDFIEVENCLLLGEFKIPRKNPKYQKDQINEVDIDFDINDEFLNSQSSLHVEKSRNNAKHLSGDLENKSFDNFITDCDFDLKFLGELKDTDFLENFNISENNVLVSKRPLLADNSFENDLLKPLKKIHSNSKPSTSLDVHDLN